MTPPTREELQAKIAEYWESMNEATEGHEEDCTCSECLCVEALHRQTAEVIE